MAEPYRWWLPNAFQSMWLLGLGDFSLDAYMAIPESERAMRIIVLALFVISTFFITITIFNMLIAVMGDIYGQTMEEQDKMRSLAKL